MRDIIRAIIIFQLAASYAASGSQAPLSAEGVLDAMRAVYSALDTYSDAGTAVEYYASEKFAYSYTFQTHHKKKSKFILKVDGADVFDRKKHFVTWNDGNLSRRYINSGEESYLVEDNIEKALQSSSDYTAQLSVTIPSLLYENVHNLFHKGDIQMNIVNNNGEYYHITFTYNGSTYQMWIEEGSLLLRRVLQTSGLGVGEVKHYLEITYSDIHLNEPIEDKAFIYEPMRIKRALSPIFSPIIMYILGYGH